ncbi:MAG: aldehyde dehydrogenase family protein [Ilumatobacteraceae bacterium]|nr:aldehyde dehydrogenase family protein [Ilumatobacteraceae bacterium]
MSLFIKSGTAWSDVFARAQAEAPEAFLSDRLCNLVNGEWVDLGVTSPHLSPVDATVIPGPPLMSGDQAAEAMAGVVRQHKEWSKVPLDERKSRVAQALVFLREQRDTIALFLVWEIGKPWSTACADVDRCIDGVEWYLTQIDRQMESRRPLDGPVSNIASWNYPLSVLVHAELVQLLAGNAVIAKTPTQGGFHALTLAHVCMVRAGLPVALVSGSGAALSEALISSQDLGALAFVGGRTNGRKVATTLADFRKRHILEQEGLNAWGIWNYSQWDDLSTHLRKGFEYAKQRCTAYPRYVVQRSLLPAFLEMYFPVVDSLKFGHPCAVENDNDPLPELHFGPVIQRSKAESLRVLFDEAIKTGGIPLLRDHLERGRFISGQDTSAYIAPACVLAPPSGWALHHSEPFGPLDSIVLVDTEAELLAAMNASNGSLVASLATDDLEFAERVRDDIQAFKVGINKPRSRGDREEVFGGRGGSWKGAFVGGDLLVDAVTQGDRALYGNFPDGSRYPRT